MSSENKEAQEIEIVEVEIEDFISSPATSSHTKSRSKIHQHFTLITSDDRYHCHYCKKTYKRNPTGALSGLWNHMRNDHSKLLDENSSEEKCLKRKSFFSSESSLAKAPVFDASVFREKLVRFVVIENEPFTITESKSLKEMLMYLNPEAVPPSGDTTKNNIVSMYKRYKLLFIEKLQNSKSKVSFIIDCWTSKNQKPFQGVIASWINENSKIEECILDLTILEGDHTGSNLADAFATVMDEFQLWGKIQSITTDNASNMDTFFKKFTNIASSKGHPFEIANKRVRCLAHIINLACQGAIKHLDRAEICLVNSQNSDVFENENESDEEDEYPVDTLQLLDKIRAAVVKIRGSPKRRKLFESQCEALKIKHKELIRDNKTRWNSVFSMIKRIVEMKRAFIQTIQLDRNLQKYHVAEADWNKLNLILEFLSPFRDMTLQIESNEYPSISLCGLIYIHLYRHVEKYVVEPSRNLKGIDASTNEKYPEWLGLAASAAYDKLDKYYPSSDGLTYVAATILNPRFKLEWYKSIGFPKALIKTYERMVSNDWNENYKSTPEDSEETSALQPLNRAEDLIAQQMKTRNIQSKTELERYLSSPVTSATDMPTGPVKWWTDRKGEFPQLSLMAMDYLAVPGSGASVERMFSNGTDLLSQRRQSMSAETIKQSMCLRGWLLSLNQEELKSLHRRSLSNKILGDFL